MQYPHVFEEAVLENIKNWVIDDASRIPSVDHKCPDYEMLKTFSTGLLAVSLAGYAAEVDYLPLIF